MDDLEQPSSPRKKLKMNKDPDSSIEDVIRSANPSNERLISTMQELEASQLSKENEVGITEFVSPGMPGFSGILKKRYTDFIVCEILPSGQVVHLDNLKAPKHGSKAEQSTQTESAPTAPIEHEPQTPKPPPEPLQLDEIVKPHSGTDDINGSTTYDGTHTHKVTIQPTNATADWQAYASKPAGFELTPEDMALLTSFFTVETVTSILALYNRVLNSPHRKTRDYGSVKSSAITERDLRTKIHQTIRRIFSSRLESATDENGIIVVSAATSTDSWGTRAGGRSNNSGKQPQQKGKLGWQDLGGEYLHFSLYKENKDTMEVISYLARQLKVNPKSFQFAGTKDRRAVTVQRISAYRIHAERMVPVGRSLRNASIGNYRYEPRGLELGELTGNEFVITLRDCRFDGIGSEDITGRNKEASKLVEASVDRLSEFGFINYYGLQRFGTFSTRTDIVGVKMLQGQFKYAIDAILEYSSVSLAAAQDPLSSNDRISYDDKARASAIYSFRTSGKANPALDNLPKKFSAEANIIRHLGNIHRSNDYQGALQSIPRALRLMYVHAYQSLVWNFTASQRWRLFGKKVLAGDLVLVEEHKDGSKDAVNYEEVDADGEIVIKPAVEDSAVNAEVLFTRARVLNKEEAESGHYNIFDVVLPTPGYDILYPTNEVGEFYRSFMGSKLGGGLDPLDMRRAWKDISLSGSYRKLLAKPREDISALVQSYSRDDEQFVQTDIQRLEARHQHVQAQSYDYSTTDQEDQKGDHDKVAVILKLQLGSSQYATMALRELMKLGGVQTYKPDFGGGR